MAQISELPDLFAFLFAVGSVSEKVPDTQFDDVAGIPWCMLGAEEERKKEDMVSLLASLWVEVEDGFIVEILTLLFPASAVSTGYRLAGEILEEVALFEVRF